MLNELFLFYFFFCTFLIVPVMMVIIILHGTCNFPCQASQNIPLAPWRVPRQYSLPSRPWILSNRAGSVSVYVMVADKFLERRSSPVNEVHHLHKLISGGNLLIRAPNVSFLLRPIASIYPWVPRNTQSSTRIWYWVGVFCNLIFVQQLLRNYRGSEAETSFLL